MDTEKTSKIKERAEENIEELLEDLPVLCDNLSHAGTNNINNDIYGINRRNGHAGSMHG